MIQGIRDASRPPRQSWARHVTRDERVVLPRLGGRSVGGGVGAAAASSAASDAKQVQRGVIGPACWNVRLLLAAAPCTVEHFYYNCNYLISNYTPRSNSLIVLKLCFNDFQFIRRYAKKRTGVSSGNLSKLLLLLLQTGEKFSHYAY